jgi:hypothetical protein
MSKFTLVLDSSQISTFSECATLWNYQYNKRLVPAVIKPNEAMNAGTYGHKLLDIYYRLKRRGCPLNDILTACLEYDPDKDTCECGCSKEHHKIIELIALEECQRCHRCLKFRPRPFPLSSDVRIQVRTRLKDYFMKYANTDFMPLSEGHVEVGFSEPIYEDDENLFILEGRLDAIAQQQGLNMIVDHKFQFKQHWLYPKSIQFKNYALVGKICLLMINYIRLHKQLTDETLARVLVSFTVPELLAWKKELISIYFRIKQAQLLSTYDRNWYSCKGYSETYKIDEPRYCIYNKLCEEFNSDMKAI